VIQQNTVNIIWFHSYDCKQTK